MAERIGQMTHKNALTTIKVEVAQHGRVTKEAMRIYVENRVSYQAFRTACNEGGRIYMAQNG